MIRLFTLALAAALIAACSPVPQTPVPPRAATLPGPAHETVPTPTSGPESTAVAPDLPAPKPTSTSGGPTPTTDYVALPDVPGGGGIAPFVPAESPYAPQPGDDQLARAEIVIEAHELAVREGFPVEVTLNLRGDLPASCHQLRVVVGAPDKAGNVRVQAYSVYDSQAVCTLMLEKFDVSIPLGTFTGARHFTVLLNGEKVGEFDA